MLMLPYYPKGSKELIIIKNKSNYYRLKHDINIIHYRTHHTIEKRCNMCGVVKPLTRFYRRFGKPKNYYISTCIECHSMTNKKRVYNTKKHKLSHLSVRLKALSKIQNDMKCVRCGCDDYRFLEINHKNGIKTNEDRKMRNSSHIFYRNIIKGERKTDDLELLCRPCNHIHYLESKFGKVNLKVIWIKGCELL